MTLNCIFKVDMSLILVLNLIGKNDRGWHLLNTLCELSFYQLKGGCGSKTPLSLRKFPVWKVLIRGKNETSGRQNIRVLTSKQLKICVKNLSAIWKFRRIKALLVGRVGVNGHSISCAACNRVRLEISWSSCNICWGLKCLKRSDINYSRHSVIGHVR